MQQGVIITCAVTGAGDAVEKHPGIPVTPEQISLAVIEAAQAGAAVAHIHVRDPKTGKASRKFEYYQEVVERVRAQSTDVILNITAGMGGDFFPDPECPHKGGVGTDMVGPEERVAHIEKLSPEICTLDCGTLYTAKLYPKFCKRRM